MAHCKRKKSKRSVRCTMCTQDRWKGNSAGRFNAKEGDELKQKISGVSECCGLNVEDCVCDEQPRKAG